MIKSVEHKSSSFMLNSNITINVVHEHFSVDVTYMVFYYQHEGKWTIDSMDWNGEFCNLRIDDVIVSDKDCQNYFDIMKKLGVKYEEEVLDSVEEYIREYGTKNINFQK